MTETLKLPDSIIPYLGEDILVFCLECEILLYHHPEENIVLRSVANDTMMQHASQLGHRVIRIEEEVVV